MIFNHIERKHNYHLHSQTPKTTRKQPNRFLLFLNLSPPPSLFLLPLILPTLPILSYPRDLFSHDIMPPLFLSSCLFLLTRKEGGIPLIPRSTQRIRIHLPPPGFVGPRGKRAGRRRAKVRVFHPLPPPSFSLFVPTREEKEGEKKKGKKKKIFFRRFFPLSRGREEKSRIDRQSFFPNVKTFILSPPLPPPRGVGSFFFSLASSDETGPKKKKRERGGKDGRFFTSPPGTPRWGGGGVVVRKPEKQKAKTGWVDWTGL